MSKALPKSFSVHANAAPTAAAVMELVCQADSLPVLKTVIDHGADCVHLDCGNAAAGPEFHHAAIGNGIRYAHDNRCKVLLALNTSSSAFDWAKWRGIIDRAAQAGVDAIIFSDPSLLLYAAAHYPRLGLHFSMSAAAINVGAMNIFHRRYGVSRILLPRVLTLAQLAKISREIEVELEVSGFGSRCTLVAGRANGLAADTTHPGSEACCAPARVTGLGAGLRNISVGHCASAETAANNSDYAMQAAPGIGALTVLPQLMKIGVRAIKVETRGPDLADVAQMTRIWREAIDICVRDPRRYSVKSSWLAEFNKSPARRGRFD